MDEYKEGEKVEKQERKSTPVLAIKLK